MAKKRKMKGPETLLVYDDRVAQGTTASAPLYAGLQYSHRLARRGMLSIQVVCANASGTGTFRLALEGSNDGLSWFARTGTHVIQTANLSQGAVTTKAWSTNASGSNADGPLLRLTRFALYFGNTTTGADVKVYVTTRRR